ncbi:MAG TPA: glycosyltransferase family 39 protein [Myxococcota bacterium]|nr:glycosyltransferase family 39 protein [Myxococcota bacterium]
MPDRFRRAERRWGRLALRERTREALVLAALLVLAGALRAQHWAREDVLFNDGPEFLRISKAMAARDWGAALADNYHPLYSFATLATELALPLPKDGYVSAAVLVSVVAGVASVLCLYLFVRSAYGAEVAWLAALALAVHPYALRFSADVQSDGLYLALFLAAVASLWVALREGAPAVAGWAGAFSGLAYLTRPEGVGVALVGSVMGTGLGALRVLRGEESAIRWVRWLAALGGACLLVMAPYLVSIRLETGAWHLTKKKSLERVAFLEEERGVSPTSPPDVPQPSASAPPAVPAQEAAPSSSAPLETPAPSRGHSLFLGFLSNVGSTMRPEIVLLLLVGLYCCRGPLGLRGAFVLALLASYGAVFLSQELHYGYLSRRHVLPPLVLTFGYAAVGLPVLGSALVSLGERLFRAKATPRPRLALGLGLLCLLAPSLGKELRPRDHGGLAERRAAEWLRAEGLAPGAVAASKDRVAYYADAPFVPLRHAPDAGLVADLKARGARYLIVEEDGAEGSRAAQRAREGGLTLLHRVEAGGREAWVYALPAPQGEGP